ncbi:MAG: DUF6133 family protein [Oscillospiraceae bacterium]|nr:DUF6133 family protein [Oscillospiraceae bacterium]
MKKFMKNACCTITLKAMNLREKLCEKRAEGYVDTAIKILIAVVLGALLLAGLYALFSDTVLFSLRYIHDRDCYA